MKHISDYITESALSESDKQDFVDTVAGLRPGVPVDVKRYFNLMYDAGISVHPDDSWENCDEPFSHDQCDILDEFISKALEIHGDAVYDWGFEILSGLHTKH